MFPFPSPLLMQTAVGAASGSHSRWRLNLTTSDTWIKLYDAQFRGSIGGADQVPVCTAEDMSPNGIVSESTFNSGSPGWLAFDSDPTGTNWISALGTSGGWLAFQFPSSVDVQQFSITTAPSSSNPGIPTGIDLQYSDDGSTWTTRATFAGLSLAASSTYTFASAAVPAFTAAPTTTTNTGLYGVGDLATVAYAFDTSSSLTGIAVSLQWTRDGVAIGGATGSSYTFVSADAGHTVACSVTLTNTIGATITTASAGHSIATPTFSSDTRVTSAADIRVTSAGDIRTTSTRVA